MYLNHRTTIGIAFELLEIFFFLADVVYPKETNISFIAHLDRLLTIA